MVTSMRGYTIFEVMIVLAVTGVIFLSAVTLFSGRQDKTQFSQSLFDLQSKIQSYANQVSTGSFPGTNDLKCYVKDLGSDAESHPHHRASLVSPTSPLVASSNYGDCVYIGKAVELVRSDGVPATKANKLYTYDVLGLHYFYANSCATATSDVATSVAQACPTPAANYDVDPHKYVSFETYTPLSGLKLLSAKFNSNEADVLALYSAFQTASASSQGLTAYAVPSLLNYNAPEGANTDEIETQFRDCIDLQHPISGVDEHCDQLLPVSDKGWKLCIQDTNTNRKVELVVYGTSTGISTKLNMASTCT
jgi:type II secretory pathway pseudopilin PulG